MKAVRRENKRRHGREFSKTLKAFFNTAPGRMRPERQLRPGVMIASTIVP